VAIYRRGDFWHFDFVVDGERYRGSTKLAATTQKPTPNVRAWVKAYRERAVMGEVSRNAISLEDAADKWFAARADGKKSAKTTMFRILILMRHLGAETLVPSIDNAAVEAAMQGRRLEPTNHSRKDKVRFPANATVNRDIIDTLRPIMRYARKYLRQPTQDIDWTDLRLEQPRPRVREFTEAEFAAWKAHLPAWHWPIVEFMARYGTRLRETFFAPSAFDGERVTIKATERKNKRTHVVPILPEHRATLAAIAGRAAQAELPTIWFREVEEDGEPKLEPIHWRGFQSASKKAQRLAGIEDARPAHDLRHHAATMALRRSKNLGAVKKLLGHDNIQSTMRYAHSDEADVLEALGHKIPHNRTRRIHKAKEEQ
jgi:hypothetical protein